jgi:hypothetical protein
MDTISKINSDKNIDIDYTRLNKLKNDICKLQECEYIEIITILEKNNIKYTKNKNGYFINLTKMPENIIKEIEEFIVFVKNNLQKLNK